MEQITAYIKKEFQYSDYQIELIKYVLVCFFSEMSKAILFAIYFYQFNLLKEFLCSVLVLLILRWNTGGVHFQHYSSCLCATLTVFILAVQLLPAFAPSLPQIIISLILCVGVIMWIGPVSSPRRPRPSEELKKTGVRRASIFIAVFSFICIIYPDNHYIIIGYWTIVLQAVQLIIAKLLSERRKIA